MEPSSTREYVARHASRFVDEWRELCRIPSISVSSAPELADAAEWVRARAARVFDAVDVVEVPGHAPVVIAELEGSGPGRLLLYSHYDVQPVEPLASR